MWANFLEIDCCAGHQGDLCLRKSLLSAMMKRLVHFVCLIAESGWHFHLSMAQLFVRTHCTATGSAALWSSVKGTSSPQAGSQLGL